MPLPLNLRTGQQVPPDQRDALRRLIIQGGLGNYRAEEIEDVRFEALGEDRWEIVLILRLGTAYKPFRP